MEPLNHSSPATVAASATGFSVPPFSGGRGELGRSLGLTILSGLLLMGALPHLDWGWLAWFGLVPFLCLFPFRSYGAAFGHGLVLGIFYLGGMSYWVAVFAARLIGAPLSLLGWALLTLCEAFFLGLWALGSQWLAQRSVWAWRLGIPALWAFVEWMRQSGSLGLSWGDLGYMQHRTLAILQMTRLTGLWGPAFLIVLVNVALTDLVRTRRLNAGTGVAAGLFVLTLAYGMFVLKTERLRPQFVAAALQNNIDQNRVANPERDKAYTQRVLRVFEAQSREAARHGAALAVWPETAFPGHLVDDEGPRTRAAAAARRSHQVQVIGSVEYDWELRQNANSVFMMGADGILTGSYQKQQLVPFGEYVPGGDHFPFLEALHVTPANMKKGGDTQALLNGGPVVGKVGATICFESSYPRYLRDQVARGAGLLVISTDDTWFGRTAEIRQHTAVAAVRAAETDRYLVRSAATGVSQVIDPNGRVLAEAGLFRSAVVWAPVESRTTQTLYVRWGDWFAGLCALLAAVLAFWPRSSVPQEG